jgi:uncharacterized protein YbjT (DUF2867 family)
MYVILGANGNTGSVAAQTLLAAGKKVRVVARDASKLDALKQKGAEVMTADLLDAASLAKAFDGADEGAYLLCPPDNASTDLIGRGKKIIDNYVTALGKSNVKHVVFLSSVGAQLPSGTGPIMITHYAETTLPKVANTKFTFLRAAYFMENILGNAYPMKNDGVLPVFGGGEAYPFPMVATKDIGRVAGETLLAPPAQTQVIELMGPKEYSLADAAKEASQILGREVKPTVLPLAQLKPTFMQFGFSENVAGLFEEMVGAFGSGKVSFENKNTKRGTVPLGDVLRGGLR